MEIWAMFNKCEDFNKKFVSRYDDCAVTMEENSLILFPGEFTHLYNFNSKSSKEFIVFSTMIHQSSFCSEINGSDKCEGFWSNENQKKMRKQY